MPMIDVYFPEGLIPSESYAELGRQLTNAVLRAEGVAVPTPTHLNNTAAFLHPGAASTISTAANGSAQVVRIEVLTPPGVLSRNGQKELVRDATNIVASLANDATLAQRTWVLLKEAAEGGWGIAGTAFGKEEFEALAHR